MEAFKCDRCGFYYDNDDHETTLLLVKSGRKFLDLCPNCYKALEQFMKPAVPAWDRTCRECKHQNGLPTADPCYSCSMRFPTFDNWEAMDGED